jgi:predicted O-methyltransferase YrrM
MFNEIAHRISEKLRNISNNILLYTVIKGHYMSPVGKALNEIKNISMLHTDVLILLHYFAKRSEGAILEIGPYVGGSTIAICEGIKASSKKAPFISIEKGGQYLTHPHIPSKDIFDDLQKNLEKYKVKPFVKLLKGTSYDPIIIQTVQTLLNKDSIALLLIDADGNIENDFKIYLPYCKPGCILVIDDYTTESAQEKGAPTKAHIDKLVKEGKIKPFGVYGFGTWVGVVR